MVPSPVIPLGENRLLPLFAPRYMKVAESLGFKTGVQSTSPHFPKKGPKIKVNDFAVFPYFSPRGKPNFLGVLKED